MLALWRDWEKRCEYAASETKGIPKLSCRMPEGAFYTWIDIRKTGETSVDFCERMLRDQHVALVPGVSFSPQGGGYVRMKCVKSWQDLEAGLRLIAHGVK